MLEQQPILALLLLVEQHTMAQQKNWQKLMARLTIVCTEASEYLASKHLKNMTQELDVIYLDPMFPEDSYQDSKTGKGAKVGKHMQALHQLALPPTLDEELQLLQSAQIVVSQQGQRQGRVIVKRPQFAPLLADLQPSESWSNEAVRFDGYFA